MGKITTHGRCKKLMTIMLTVITLAVMLCPKQIEAAVNGITIVSKAGKERHGHLSYRIIPERP